MSGHGPGRRVVRSDDALEGARQLAAPVGARSDELEGGGSRRALPAPGADDGDKTAAVESFLLALLAGQKPTTDLRRVDLIGWWDALWWDDPTESDPADRATARRVVAALRRIEQDGADAVPVTLDADLTALCKVPALATRGVALLVGCLLLVDRPGTARTVLDTQVPWPDEATSLLDQLSLHLAEALVAAREGRYRQVRRQLGLMTQVEPRCRSWLSVRGLLAVSDAILDGVEPPLTVPDDHVARTRRALGEYAIDLASAHSVVGQPGAAASLFAVGIEQCPWPRQGRNHVAAVAVSSLHLAPDHRELRLFTETVLRQAARPRLEEHDPDAAQARALLLMLPGTSDSLTEIGRLHSAAAMSGASLEHQVHARIVLGYQLARRDEHPAAQAAFDHAATLARLAGMDGWCAAITALGEAARSDGGPAGWDEIDDVTRSIVRLVVRGATNSEAAQAVFVSERTVVNRLHAVYERLGIAGRSQLIERAERDRPGWIYAGDATRAS